MKLIASIIILAVAAVIGLMLGGIIKVNVAVDASEWHWTPPEEAFQIDTGDK